jgi:hypothetical protein
MTTEIQLYKITDMQIMAEAVAKSGLFGMKTPDQALALMLVAQSENCHPATITQDYDIIQGKACRKTHSVMARFQQMGGTVEWHELTDKKADATFTHKAGGSLRITWTIEQAQKANLTSKDNWKNYPRAMLRARCIAEGIRAVYPAAIGGMMVAEEAQDSGEIELNPRPGKPTPQSAAASNVEAGFDEYEAEHLPAMREAAMGGQESLAEAFKTLPKGPHKAAFWQKHQTELKAAASPATIDHSTGEVMA